MTKDSSFTYIHLTSSRHADLFEEFTRPTLAPEDIFIPPSRLPPNPEDEDDVVPDQHAAFGIQRATQARREPAWRDLGMLELVNGSGLRGSGGGTRMGSGIGRAGGGSVAGRAAVEAVAGLGRGAGVGVGTGGMGLGSGQIRGGGRVADVGARRGEVIPAGRRMLPR